MSAIQQMFGNFKTAIAATTDSLFNYVSTLLNGDGVANAQANATFLDSSTNAFTVTNTGSPIQSTFTPFSQSGYSMSFTAADFFNTPSSASFGFGAGAFTVECWAYFTVVDSGQYLFLGNSFNGNSFGWGINNGFMVSSTNGAGQGTSVTSPVVAGQWYHMAWCRTAGNSYKYFLNGVQVFSGSNSTSIPTTTFPIGQSATGASGMSGYLSNVRVNNTALYTTGFTPATANLTAVTGTVLLTAQNGRAKDNSTSAFAITVGGGTPTIQPTSPWESSSSYSASIVGGSVYTNGSSDYITVPDNANLELGSSNFTIECWIYPITAVNSFFTKTTSGTTTWELSFNSNNVVFTASADGTTKTINKIGSIAPILNTWNHVAVTRNGNVFTLWLNGASSATQTTSFTIFNSSDATAIGGRISNDAFYNGYVSNARIVVGTAVYTGAFTPPTAPLTAITNTQYLMLGTNAGIYDQASRTAFYTQGAAQISTSVVKYGTGAMSFNGTTSYLNGPNSSPLAMALANFTIEMWIYINTTGSAMTLYDSGASAGLFPRIDLTSTNTLNYVANSATRITGTNAIPITTWTHIAVARSGTSTKLFINGVQEGSTYTDSNNYLCSANKPVIGVSGNITGFFNGYIDDLRVTQGQARYTTTFTPPSAAFPTH